VTARVSVIIPTYRRPQLLQRAIRSVVRQTFQDFRACVYDNASGDETARVVADASAHDARVEYNVQPENVGAFDNFVYGMQRVDTEFFSFLSDDDVLFPDFLTSAVRELDHYPDAMMFAGSTLELDDSGKVQYAPVARWPREGRYEPPEAVWHMLGNRHPTWTSILFRRAVIDRIGLLDKDAGAPCDLDYELQIAAHFPIVISFEPCAAYVRHDQARSQREDTTVVAGYQHIAEKFRADTSLEPNVRNDIAIAIERQLRLKLVEIAVKSVVRGDDTIARDALNLLKDYPATALGVLARITLPIGMNVPLARGVLAAAETIRLQLRAASARRLTAATSGPNSLKSGFAGLDPHKAG
jgi:Glycosyl transferase family 2